MKFTTAICVLALAAIAAAKEKTNPKHEMLGKATLKAFKRDYWECTAFTCGELNGDCTDSTYCPEARCVLTESAVSTSLEMSAQSLAQVTTRTATAKAASAPRSRRLAKSVMTTKTAVTNTFTSVIVSTATMVCAKSFPLKASRVLARNASWATTACQTCASRMLVWMGPVMMMMSVKLVMLAVMTMFASIFSLLKVIIVITIILSVPEAISALTQSV